MRFASGAASATVPRGADPVADRGVVSENTRDPDAALLWASAALNAVDYGIAVLAADGTLRMANAQARRAIRSSEVLRLDEEGRLRANCARDNALLAEARNAACKHGLRKLLHLGDGRGPLLSLSGIMDPNQLRGASCLVLLSKGSTCERLALDLFARLKGLTPAESDVMAMLAEGLRPSLVAQRMGVRLSTVRTHILRILAKNDLHSMRDLAQRLSSLPPVPNLALVAA